MPSKQITDLQSLTVAASGTITLVSDSGVTKQMALSVINHNLITNKGTNTHANLDAELALTVAHRANISNPHSVTKTQIGLSAVTNDAQVKVTDIGTTVLAPTGNGSALTGIANSITNITGDTTIASTQMTGKIIFYNSAQAAITLPAATAGLTATFEINNSGGIRFIRNSVSDTFTCGGTASLAALPVGGTTYDVVVGGLYELICYTTGVWTVRRRGIQPAIHVTKNADQTGIADNTLTLISWQTENKDNNNEFASSIHSPLTPGEYTFDIALGISAQTAADKVYIVLYKNGTWFDAMMFLAVAGSYIIPTAHFKDWNDGNDTYKVFVDLQGGGGTVYRLEPVQGVNASYFKASRTPD